MKDKRSKRLRSNHSLTLQNHKRRGENEDEGAYQVDLVVAFFSILLILLVISSTRFITELKEPSLLEYENDEEKSEPFMLRSFAPLYPYRDIWIIKDSLISLVDFGSIAVEYRDKRTMSVKRAELKLKKYNGNVELTVVPSESQLDGYRLDLGIIGPKVPDVLMQQAFDAKNSAAVLKTLRERARGALIYVWHSDQNHAQRLTPQLREAGLPHKIVYLREDDNTIRLQIDRASFSYDNILRAY